MLSFITVCSTISSMETINIPDQAADAWQDILQITAEIFHVPAALIMQVKGDTIEVFASSGGKDNPYHPGDKELVWDSGLYCEYVIKTQKPLQVPYALEDPKWKDNPDVSLKMISYLGFPILLPDEKPFGTICVLDSKKRKYSDTYFRLLSRFRDMIQHDLELLYMNQTLGESYRKMSDFLGDLQKLKGIVSICSYCKSIKDHQGCWHPVESYLIDHPHAQFSHGVCPNCISRIEM